MKFEVELPHYHVCKYCRKGEKVKISVDLKDIDVDNLIKNLPILAANIEKIIKNLPAVIDLLKQIWETLTEKEEEEIRIEGEHD